MNEHMLFNLVDLAGTFAFAISGATAARRCNLDLFGILAIAYITACGGGIARDLCIGAIPPAGLSDWRYLATAVIAAAILAAPALAGAAFRARPFGHDAAGPFEALVGV